MSTSLSATELASRAQQIKLVLTDVDGVLTDTGVYYSARGEEMKRFSIRDGMGIEILREHGIETAMITREASDIVRSRSERLKLPYMYLGVWDKLAVLPQILSQSGFGLHELAYIGDDVNDLDIMQHIAESGLVGCPKDAMPTIAEIAHYRASATGGNGAFRDFAEWILRLRSGL